jgi:NAD(P)-dependent dehydrogenase (short-subunit alcohol dehydrogenase family)
MGMDGNGEAVKANHDPGVTLPRPVSIGSNLAERRLHGKVAVITGASNGIGESTARELARLGASVVLTARRIDLLEKIAREIEATGGKAFPLVADTTKPEDLRQMVQIAVDNYGRLDYAVNNAGIGSRGEFLDIKEEDFSRVMETNVRGVFLAMQAEIPALLQSGGGAIVNVASVGGIVGIPGISAYVASKHAVVGLTKSVAIEYATRNIRINALAPGATETEIYAHSPRELKDRLASYSAMKRWAAPQEMACAITYLLADATFSTGIVLAADGGQSAS